MTGRISLTVNGRRIESTVEPRTHLADFLRDTLRLTGTHLGCEHGVCGACTVLIDGAPIRSCITFAIACEGAHVRTIEAFEHDPLMRTLRKAFARRHALQCGYCTPGMLLTAYDIVRRLPGADESRVREELSGNLCRCTAEGSARGRTRVGERRNRHGPQRRRVDAGHGRTPGPRCSAFGERRRFRHRPGEHRPGVAIAGFRAVVGGR